MRVIAQRMDITSADVSTVVCLTTAGRNSPDDGFSPADPTVVIRPCRVATLRTASAPTATNALVSIPLVSIPVHWNGRRDGMDWYPMHWSPITYQSIPFHGLAAVPGK